jgi:hypothetical protein
MKIVHLSDTHGFHGEDVYTWFEVYMGICNR